MAGKKNPKIVLYGAAAGSAVRGNCENVDPRVLGPNQPRKLVNGVTDKSGTLWRPMPGPRPLANIRSLDHRGPTGQFAADYIPRGGSFWLLNPERQGDMIAALVCHDKARGAGAQPNIRAGRVVVSRGVVLDSLSKLHFNHKPLCGRNADYSFHRFPLVRAFSDASITEYKPTSSTPNFLVVAADGNPVMAVGETAKKPRIGPRLFGFAAPQIDNGFTAAVPQFSGNGPFGDQLALKGTATGGAETLDPDTEWDLDLGGAPELEAVISDPPRERPSQDYSRLIIVIPEADITAGAISGNITVTGTKIDPTDPAQPITENFSEVIPLQTGLSVPSVAGKYLWVSWSGVVYQTETWFVSKNLGDDVTITFSGGTAGVLLKKVLVFRRGEAMDTPLEPDVEPVTSQWDESYAWGRTIGRYKYRGPYFQTPRGRLTVPPGNNIRLALFGPPLKGEFMDEEPTELHALCQKYPDRRNIANAAGQSAFTAFYRFRTLPIRYDVAAEKWKTNTGFPDHDVDLEDAVVENPYSERQLVESGDRWPGTGRQAGGYCIAERVEGFMAFAAQPSYLFQNIQGSLGSKIWTSSTDIFEGWMIGLPIKCGANIYYILHILDSGVDSGSAELEMTAECRESHNAPASILADYSTVHLTIDDGLYGELVPSTFAFKLNEPDDIMAIRVSNGNYVIQGRINTYIMQIPSVRTNIYQELPEIPGVRIEKILPSNGSAGIQCFALMGDMLASFTGRGVSVGVDVLDLRDITREENSHIWRSDGGLTSSEFNRFASLGYCENNKHLVVTGLVPPNQPNGGVEPELGVILDAENNWALSLAYPFGAATAGQASLSHAARPRQAIRDGVVLFVCTVAFAGSNPAPGVVGAGDYVVIYDDNDQTFQAFPLAPLGLAVGESDGGENVAACQTIRGEIVCEIGQATTRRRLRFRYDEDAQEWTLDPVSATPFGKTLTYATCEAYNGGFHLLGESELYAGQAALWEFANDDVEFPYRPGGRGRVLSFDSAIFGAGFATSEIRRVLMIGPGGEIVVLGQDAGNLKIALIDQESYQLIEPVQSVAVPNTAWGFQMNAHRELCWLDAGGGNITLNRYRWEEDDFPGGAVQVSSIAPPVGAAAAGLLVDTRSILQFAYPLRNFVDTGLRVRGFANANGGISVMSADIFRGGFHRELKSIVQMGQAAWYLFEDIAVGGGSPQYRFVQATGVGVDGDGNYLFDGYMDAAEDEEDVNWFNLHKVIAGTGGGALSFISIDGAAASRLHAPSQVNGTRAMLMRGNAPI
jgi:hypothetical protein